MPNKPQKSKMELTLMWRYSETLHDFTHDYDDFRHKDKKNADISINFAGVKSIPAMWIDAPQNPKKWLTKTQLENYAYNLTQMQNQDISFNYEQFKKDILNKKLTPQEEFKREQVYWRS